LNGWLVDTNVVSELKRPRPSALVVDFLAAQPVETLHISCVSLAELRFGVLRATTPARAAEIDNWLDEMIRPMFAGRVIDVTEAAMLRWRLLVDEGRKAGHTFSQPDLIIAAQALEEGLTLVTRNTPDFARTRVPLLNPWSDR
jgi:predicted nucleic acid-binding protein